MATHSSVLAWRIPGTGEPGGCRLWDHTESVRCSPEEIMIFNIYKGEHGNTVFIFLIL